uniref:Coenzyme Q-binding protein COQ10 START domain-containing protein n=1 Tax=Haptolina brevifila TaxID=156173 RepID=A0A7S2NH04_9EUKA
MSMWMKLEVLVVLAAAIAYAYTPGAYTKAAPLTSLTFKVSLPRKQVAKLLVTDFKQTGGLWIDRAQSISKIQNGFLVKSDQYDMVVQWSKTGDFKWEEVNLYSPLFLTKDMRPTAAEIVKSPGIDWRVEWTLREISATETEVQRVAFHFEQFTNKVVPLHLLVSTVAAAENQAIATKFVER